jgi:translocation and assembly module TamB
MGGAVDLALQDSTLSKSPLWGHARLAADKHHVSNADVDLHLGGNVVAASGAFGSGRDTLHWRIDAPQLAALGPDFGGALRGSGTVSGTMDTPSLTASVEGQNIRALGTQSVRALKATANLGSGRGAADPLALDVAITDYASTTTDKQGNVSETKIASARLTSTGTRGAHTIQAAARGDTFDAALAVHGGLTGNAWNGTVDSL